MERTMSREYAKVIAKAWIDPSFKASLMQDPVTTLSEYGITLPEGTDFSNFMLPSTPVSSINEPSTAMVNSASPEIIHTCPEPDHITYKAVTLCPSPMALVHDQHLNAVYCPAE